MIRLGTHVISAILNVGQKVDQDWPLHIQDNQGNHHQVCTMMMTMEMMMPIEMMIIIMIENYFKGNLSTWRDGLV